MLVAVVGGLLAGLGVIDTWIVYVAVLGAAVPAVWWYMRTLHRWRGRRDAAITALEATGRWTVYDLPGRTETPEGVQSLPKRKPLASDVGHTYGPPLSTTVHGKQVWSFELGVQYRTGRTQQAGAPKDGVVLSDPFHVVLTHLDQGFGQVDVTAPGLVDRWRSDVQVGVPDFDEKFVVRSESERTAHRWLTSGLGAELARSGPEALHDGTLRLDGRTLLWWRKGHVDLDILDDVAHVVGRAAAYLPR